MNENSDMHQVSESERYLEAETLGHIYHLSPVELLQEYLVSHPGTGIYRILYYNNKTQMHNPF